MYLQKDADEELMKKAKDGMMGDEAQFSVEVPLEKQTMIWSDKYKPRKPRFFNRVHTVRLLLLLLYTSEYAFTAVDMFIIPVRVY